MCLRGGGSWGPWREVQRRLLNWISTNCSLCLSSIKFFSKVIFLTWVCMDKVTHFLFKTHFCRKLTVCYCLEICIPLLLCWQAIEIVLREHPTYGLTCVPVTPFDSFSLAQLLSNGKVHRWPVVIFLSGRYLEDTPQRLCMGRGHSLTHKKPKDEFWVNFKMTEFSSPCACLLVSLWIDLASNSHLFRGPLGTKCSLYFSLWQLHFVLRLSGK